MIYGTVSQSSTSATAGVQKDGTAFDPYFCNGSGGGATGGQSYTLQGCGTPTPPTPTNPNAVPHRDAHSAPTYSDPNINAANTDTHTGPECNAASPADSRGYCAASPKSATSAGVVEEPKFARMAFGVCRPSQIS